MSELPQVERHRSLASLSIKDDKLKSLEKMVVNREEEEKVNKAREILRYASKSGYFYFIRNFESM